MAPLPRLLARATCRSVYLPSPQPASGILPAASTAISQYHRLNLQRHTHTHASPRTRQPIRLAQLPQLPLPSTFNPNRITCRFSSSSATSDPNSPTPPPPSSTPLANAISTSHNSTLTHPPRTPLKITNPRKDDDGNDMIIDITPRAVDRLHHLMQSDSTASLRITVESGGCHGFQYFLSLTNIPSDPSVAIDEEDTVFEQDGARVIIDESSLQLLKGSKVDYTMELIGRQFKVVDGPGVKSSCGCGTSFDVKL